MTLPIDVDDKKTWPSQIVDIVEKWADQLRGTTKYTSDLALPLEYEDEFRELLSGRLLRAYHCTRFLPHELQMVKEAGLRALTADLVFDRIKSAQDEGVIGTVDSKELHTSHAFAMGDQQYRENQVCFILSKNMFLYNIHGCEPLLKAWGGEGIYRYSRKPSILMHLNELSKPTVVVAHINLSGKYSPHRVYPALHKVFVGADLSFSDLGADVFYKVPVPPEYIERILQSGMPEYDLLGDLPK